MSSGLSLALEGTVSQPPPGSASPSRPVTCNDPLRSHSTPLCDIGRTVSAVVAGNSRRRKCSRAFVYVQKAEALQRIAWLKDPNPQRALAFCARNEQISKLFAQGVSCSFLSLLSGNNVCRFVASIFLVLCNEGIGQEEVVLMRSAVRILTGSPNIGIMLVSYTQMREW